MNVVVSLLGLAAPYNLEVAGPNPAPATCFSGSEILLPLGYTKTNAVRASAFLRSIGNRGNGLRRRPGSHRLSTTGERDIHVATGAGVFGAVFTRSLGRLCVSPGPGYQDVRSALVGRNGRGLRCRWLRSK
jgi:hypothetical protein